VVRQLATGGLSILDGRRRPSFGWNGRIDAGECPTSGSVRGIGCLKLPGPISSVAEKAGLDPVRLRLRIRKRRAQANDDECRNSQGRCRHRRNGMASGGVRADHGARPERHPAWKVGPWNRLRLLLWNAGPVVRCQGEAQAGGGGPRESQESSTDAGTGAEPVRSRGVKVPVMGWTDRDCGILLPGWPKPVTGRGADDQGKAVRHHDAEVGRKPQKLKAPGGGLGRSRQSSGRVRGEPSPVTSTSSGNRCPRGVYLNPPCAGWTS